MNRTLLTTAKAMAYAIIWLAAAVTLIRGVVGPLVGSASDYGLLGAVLALAGGILGLAWLAGIMLADITKGHAPKKEEQEDHE